MPALREHRPLLLPDPGEWQEPPDPHRSGYAAPSVEVRSVPEAVLRPDRNGHARDQDPGPYLGVRALRDVPEEERPCWPRERAEVRDRPPVGVVHGPKKPGSDGERWSALQDERHHRRRR